MSLAKRLLVLLYCGAVASCGSAQHPNEIVVQRFFGDCAAVYGSNLDMRRAEGECGIVTSMLNRFAADNPDIKVTVSPVAWPGYNQLSAQLAAGDAPDVVVMHASVISDYQSRGLIEPITDGLRDVAVDPRSFTSAARTAVTKDGDIYGLPFDTWAALWHINTNYFRKAGLFRDGMPVLPRTPEELLQHARQFKEVVGKPYFVQSLVNERAMFARNLYTYLAQQNAIVFPEPQRIHLRTPEARRVVELFRSIYDEDLTTKDQDYAAATNGFLNGAGGVYLGGTWVLADFERESHRPGRPLSGGYAAATYPQLFSGRDATFVDCHAWVVPVKNRTVQQRAAVFRFLKFLSDHDFEWARTGHLPAIAAVVDSKEFRSLPHREVISKLAVIGTPLPGQVQRQFAIQDIVGEEVAAAVAGHKTIDDALSDAEHRINDLLSHIP